MQGLSRAVEGVDLPQRLALDIDRVEEGWYIQSVAGKVQPYTSQLFEEDGHIVTLCPELNVSSFGDTPEEALASLQEAVTLFLEECQRMGTLYWSETKGPMLARRNQGRSSLGP